MAMENWHAAYTDTQDVYLRVNSKAGWLSMRTKELDRTEDLKAKVHRADRSSIKAGEGNPQHSAWKKRPELRPFMAVSR